MKVKQAVILAGGLGTRISEETALKPKPMVEIGGYPILWHIMKFYAHFGVTEFIICAGYKANEIKKYFADYYTLNSDVTFDFSENSVTYHSRPDENWKVSIIDTGLETQTGGRLARVKEHLMERFFLTYGDGLSDIDLPQLVAAHSKNKAEITVSAVRPPGRFGAMKIEEAQVTEFVEKPAGDGSWINGGFFLCEKKFLERIRSDSEILEQHPLMSAAKDQKLFAHFHNGFWQPMDTLRDRNLLNSMWEDGAASWKLW